MGGTLPSLSAPFISLLPSPLPISPPLRSPAAKLPTENPLATVGSSVERCIPQWDLGRRLGRKRILVYFELASSTWQQHFWLFILDWNCEFWNALRKKYSCIGKKCLNGVSAFNKSGTSFGLVVNFKHCGQCSEICAANHSHVGYANCYWIYQYIIRQAGRNKLKDIFFRLWQC